MSLVQRKTVKYRVKAASAQCRISLQQCVEKRECALADLAGTPETMQGARVRVGTSNLVAQPVGLDAREHEECESAEGEEVALAAPLPS